MIIHVVSPNESVDSISAMYNVPPSFIINANQLSYPYPLAIGQALLISDTPDASRRPIYAGGFAYPFIPTQTLENTLPFLTDLFIFSYGFTTDGQLIYPEPDDYFMLEAAFRYNVRPVMTLTSIGPDGRFDNSIISVLVNDMSLIETLVNNILLTMANKGFVSLNIDFEYIKAEDRDAFTSFVVYVTNKLNENGFTVSVDLAPKTSSDQVGLLYQGKDYGGLGFAANNVLLMTYEWGYTYGPPMAVAPINKVRQVIEYALTQIPSEKINIGIPNYGYDWPLPYERGVTKARTIGNIEAVNIAIEKGAIIQFDETAMTPYFYYTENFIQHEVWFEDPRSIRAKLELINEYSLRGADCWQIMRFFYAMWLIFDSMFDITTD